MSRMKAIKKVYCLVSYLLLVNFVLPIQGNKKDDEIKKANEACSNGTGVKISEITGLRLINDNCAVTCYTNKRLQLSIYLNQEKSCRNESKRYKCRHGKCREENERIDTNGLINIKMSILHGKIPRLSFPNKEPYIEVIIENNQGPAYDKGNIIFKAYPNQWINFSDSLPTWNVYCRPMALRLTTELRFDVYESDEKMQLLGYIIKSVEYLLNGKNDKHLPLIVEGKGNNGNNESGCESDCDDDDNEYEYDDEEEEDICKGDCGAFGEKYEIYSMKREKFWILVDTIADRPNLWFKY